MWLRGLVWLGPAGLGAMAAGWGRTLALAGGLMPLFYLLAETAFADSAADFSGATSDCTVLQHCSLSFRTYSLLPAGPGSPLAELCWGMATWFFFVVCPLGARQGPDPQANHGTRSATTAALPAQRHRHGAPLAAPPRQQQRLPHQPQADDESFSPRLSLQGSGLVQSASAEGRLVNFEQGSGCGDARQCHTDEHSLSTKASKSRMCGSLH